MGVGPGFYRCIVARPVFDNRVAGATTAESENCPWSSQFGFEFTVDFRLGQIARIGSTASAPSNAGNPRTSSRSWHLPILRSYSSKSWSVPRFSLPTWCRAKAIGKPPVGGAANADDADAATTANARTILTLHLVVSLARRQNR